MEKEIITNNLAETQNLAIELSKTLRGGEVLALSGDLGSGKTSFTQGLARSLGVKDKVNSPTFVIVKEYKTDKKSKNLHQNLSLVHIDAYRLKDKQDAKVIGVDDFLNQKDTISVIEWPEIIKDILPTNTIWIKFFHLEGDKRKIIFDNKLVL